MFKQSHTMTVLPLELHSFPRIFAGMSLVLRLANFVLATAKRNMVIIKPSAANRFLPVKNGATNMIIKLATCLLALAFCTACTTTQSTAGAGRQTLEQRLLAQNSTSPTSMDEPMPPAEGPEDIPAEGPVDPIRNPALLPSPLLRSNAAAGL
jgi:hypothetical protein